MSLTLLEKQGSIQFPMSGALINYHALGRQSGRLYGCELVQTTSETIVLTRGVLVVRGYRIDVVDEIVFDTNEVIAPVEPMKYYIFIRITAAVEDAELELIVTDSAPVNNTPIEQQVGTFDYLLGEFTFGPVGISNFTTKFNKINTSIPTGIIDGESSYWYDGTELDGITEPLVCSIEVVPGVTINSYYLNNLKGNYYKCIQVDDNFAFWEYRGNLKGPESGVSPHHQIISIAIEDWIDKQVTVEVDSILLTSYIFINPTEESYIDYVSAQIRAIEQSDGSITFTCTTTPTSIINIVVLVI